MHTIEAKRGVARLYPIRTTIAAICIALAGGNALAQTAMYELDIPAQSLAQTLRALASQTGLHLTFNDERVSSAAGPAIRGHYTAPQALEKILAGTGLTFQFDGDKEVVVRSGNSAANRTLNDAGHGNAPVSLPLIDVIGTSRAAEYAALNAVSATKTDAPIRDTPFAVQVIPEQVVLDQQTSRIQDAILGNVSNVAANANGLSDNTNFTIRGFNTGPNVYQDGLLLPYSMNVDTANINSIEVLKGPSAALYGRMPPGGLVNFTTKQPLDTPFYAVQQSIGSYGFSRTLVDLSGPVDDGKTILYRLDAAATQASSYVNFENSTNILIAPSITVRPNDRFSVTVQAEYQDVKNVDSAPNFPAFGNRPASIPISTYLEDPGVTKAFPDTMKKNFVAYQWNYKLDGDWKITNRFAYNDLDERVTNMYGQYIDGSGNLTNALMYGPAGVKTTSTDLELSGSIRTGDFQHSLLFGLDHLDFKEWFNGIADWSAQTINIFNPQAGYNTINMANELNPANGFGLLSKQSWNGVYAQDMISGLHDRAHLLIGGRYDWSTTGSGTGFGNTAWQDAQRTYYVQGKDQGFSPRIGLSLEVLPWATVYANYSKALGLSNVATGVTVSGQPLPSQWSEQKEVGLKGEFLEKRLTASIAYFDIKQRDIPSYVSAPDVYELIGAARSRGFEVDIEGRLNRNWSLITTASNTIAKITDGYSGSGSSVAAGNYLPAVPNTMASLWIKYSGSASLLGWTFAAGMTGVSQAQGDPQNDFQIPGYSLVRAMASYDFKVSGRKLTAQVNLDNLTNHRYFYGSTMYGNAFSLTPGSPRTVAGTLRMEF